MSSFRKVTFFGCFLSKDLLSGLVVLFSWEFSISSLVFLLLLALYTSLDKGLIYSVYRFKLFDRVCANIPIGYFCFL